RSSSITNNENPASLLSRLSQTYEGDTNPINNTTNRFTSARQELLANFRPTLAVSLNDLQRRRNNSNFQRNQTQQQMELKLNYIILMDKVNSTIIPKMSGATWNYLLINGFIKRDITLFQNNLNSQIRELFPILINQEWKTFNASSGKLKDVQNMVIIIL